MSAKDKFHDAAKVALQKDGTVAKLEEYREYIQHVLTDYAKRRTSPNQDDQLEMQTIFDTLRDHYQLIYVGWDKRRRVYGPVMHLEPTFRRCDSDY